MTIFGIDGSYHQFGGRFGRMKKWAWLRWTDTDWDRIGFVKWRASIGKRTDWSFPMMMAECERRGKPFAAYHFVYPLKRAWWQPTYPARVQVDALMKSLGGRTDVPVWIDWEHDGESIQPVWTDVLAVVNEMRRRGFRVPGVYAPDWYWSSHGRPMMSGYGMDLWTSWYGNQSSTAIYDRDIRYEWLGGDTSAEWSNCYGGLCPVIWQFGSRIEWGNKAMDHDAIREPADVTRWFTDWDVLPDPDPTPPPIPEEDEMYRYPFAAKLPNHGPWYVGDGYERRHTSGGRAKAQLAAGLINPITGLRMESWGDAAILNEDDMNNIVGRL